MAIPPNQKASERPISFVLHNMATGSPPREKQLVIRPEDLTRSETSRLTTHQTLGGAWADSFGTGIPTVNISGHTGWRSSPLNGLGEFIDLHETIYTAWHTERAAAVEAGLDPDKVKLIFADVLDEFTWVVAPQAFVLRRNKSRPLLSQYQISLTWLSDNVSETMGQLEDQRKSDAEALKNASDSLDLSLVTIRNFSDVLKSEDGLSFGASRSLFAEFTDNTAAVLMHVQGVIGASSGYLTKETGDLLSIAGNLSRAAANIANTFHSIITLPQRVKAELSRVAAAYNNVFCLIKNAFKIRVFLPNYDDVYGASNCSSTAGGRPVSKYATENPFPVYFPVEQSQIRVSSGATRALERMIFSDPVLYPVQLTSLMDSVSTISSGVRLQA